jgi:hypothetical protein
MFNVQGQILGYLKVFDAFLSPSQRNSRIAESWKIKLNQNKNSRPQEAASNRRTALLLVSN